MQPQTICRKHVKSTVFLTFSLYPFFSLLCVLNKFGGGGGGGGRQASIPIPPLDETLVRIW